MSRKQESPPSFILSNKAKGKNNRKNLFHDISEYGGYIIEREGVSALSICGYPRAPRYLLIVFSKFAFLCVCGFEKSFCLKGV